MTSLFARSAARIGIAVSIIAGANVLSIPSASAADTCYFGHFCAYRLSGFSDKLLDSTAGAVTRNVDVVNDKVTSGRNRSESKWCGVNEHWYGDDTVFAWQRHTEADLAGSGQDNVIDHFDVVSYTSGCLT